LVLPDFIVADAVRFINEAEGWINAQRYIKTKPGRHRILRVFAVDSGFRAIYLYRKRHHHKQANHKLRYGFWVTLNFFLNRSITIDGEATIGPGLLVKHGSGIVIGPAKIGANCTIYHHVTIGANYRSDGLGNHNPTIADNVIISPGAVVIGPITIGPNTLIGANTVVTRSLQGNSIIASAPPKIIGKFDKSRFG
jgi:serine O-acetyltransferase